MAIIRTVRGDISPDALGCCYAHDHLLGQPPPDLATSDFILDDEEAAARELGWFRDAGGQALVEMSTRDYGRDVAGLLRLSQRTGVHLVTATGFNKDKFSARLVEGETVASLAALFTREVNEGIDGLPVRAGVIKAASTLNALSPTAEKVFRAAAQTHRATGAPLSTHTEAGTMALEQLALLSAEGVAPHRIILGHLDRRLEWPYLAEVAATGAYLSFDQISKEKYYPDRERIRFILRLVEEGFGRQVLLSGDLARRSYWPAYGTGGGPGFTYILWRFIPWLREEGLPETHVQNLIRHNPARALAFEPAVPPGQP